MLTLRSLARALPRATSQFASRPVQRQFSALRNPVALSSPFRLSPIVRWSAQFSSSSRKCQDDALVAKITSEIQVEQDGHPSAAHLESYLKNSEYELKDTSGEEEVVLTRTFGNENIRIAFSVTDFSSAQPYDEAYGDEEDDIAQLANQGDNKARQPPIAPEDSIEDNEVEDHASDESSFPAQLNITITKTDRSGALVIDATARDNEISIENMAYFTDAALAEPKTFELELKRRPVYAGPPFGDLDEELQQYMQDYLAERGINEALAGFVAEYIDYKEHTEYVRWLSNLKAFHE